MKSLYILILALSTASAGIVRPSALDGEQIKAPSVSAPQANEQTLTENTDQASSKSSELETTIDAQQQGELEVLEGVHQNEIQELQSKHKSAIEAVIGKYDQARWKKLKAKELAPWLEEDINRDENKYPRDTEEVKWMGNMIAEIQTKKDRYATLSPLVSERYEEWYEGGPDVGKGWSLNQETSKRLVSTNDMLRFEDEKVSKGRRTGFNFAKSST